MTLISIIIPVLDEADNLYPLYDRLVKLSETLLPDETEFIFVDDGSTDDSLKIIKKIAEKDKRIKSLSFSRNFGSHAALLAGFTFCTGDAATILSADMQEPPEIIPEMLHKWKKKNDIVWAVREGRDDPLITKITAGFYYYLIRKFALTRMPLGGVDVCLIDRRVVDTIISMSESNTSLFGLIMWSGYSQVFIPYHREARKQGRSKWSLGKKIKLFVDSFVSFSFFPIRLVSYTGVFVSLIGFLYATYIVFNKIWLQKPIPGWSSLMFTILVLSGFQMIMLGIVSEYLWRTFDASRQRPTFIIQEKIGFEGDKDQPII